MNPSIEQPPPAHVLWVELSTRITTRRLHFRSGDEETAVESVHKLFSKTRELMAKNPDDERFLKVAGKMLNETIRPYTARWHGWMTPDPKRKDKNGLAAVRFRDPQLRRAFRQELRELQPFLLGYAKTFDLLRQGKGTDENGRTVEDLISGSEEMVVLLTAEIAREEKVAVLGGPVPLGIQPQVPFYDEFPGRILPAEIAEKEFQFLRERRKLRGCLAGDDELPLHDGIALALSGGGIKSATFCLGVVQELARRGIFRQLDYLSTVSGGGYLGTFISSYLGSKATEGDPMPGEDKERIKETFEPEESGRESTAVRHLRNHSKYLLNGGLWGKLNIAGLLASGVLSNLMMILPIPLLIAFVLGCLNAWKFWGAKDGKASPALWALSTVGCIMALFWLLLPVIQRFTQKDRLEGRYSKLRSIWEATTLGFALLTAAAALLWLFPKFQECFVWVSAGFAVSDNCVATLSGVVPITLGVAGFLIRNKRLQAVVMKLFILSGPVFYLFVVLFVTTKLGMGEWSLWGLFPIALLWLFWSVFGVNINMQAPHRYYRARLCDCYLVKPGAPELGWWNSMVARIWRGYVPQGKGEQEFGSVRNVKLSTIGESMAAPYHLINAFVNLPASKNRNLRGRAGDFYLFSRDVCGSPATGYVSTSSLEDADPRLDLGSAMAISGAAANTNMGWRSLPNFRFLMTLLNVRLGYWVPNLREWNKHGGKFKRLRAWTLGAPYLLAEMGGRIQENMNFLNLSDGGHIENLGAYELLRRKCKFIISVDGGGNRSLDGGDLQRLERYASIDFGITMDYDLAELQADDDGLCRAQAILVKIHYNQGELGWMLYLRPGITGIEPTYLLDHWRTKPEFPYESIIDQIFEEDQFEGYRCLGERVAGSLFRDDFETDHDDLPVRDLFQRVASHLRPDNDSSLNVKS